MTPVEYASEKHFTHPLGVVIATDESQMHTLLKLGAIRAGQLHTPVLVLGFHTKEKPGRHPQALEFDESIRPVP